MIVRSAVDRAVAGDIDRAAGAAGRAVIDGAAIDRDLRQRQRVAVIDRQTVIVRDRDLIEGRSARPDLYGPLDVACREANVNQQRAAGHRRAAIEHKVNGGGPKQRSIHLDGSGIHHVDAVQRGAGARHRILDVEGRPAGDRHRATIHRHSTLERDGSAVYRSCHCR